MSSHRLHRSRAVLGALLVCLPSAASAQRVAKELPAPRDTSFYVVTIGTDTLSVEMVVRGDAVITGAMRIRQPRPIAIDYAMAVRPNGLVDSLRFTQTDGPAATDATIRIGRDSAAFQVRLPGQAAPRVVGFAVHEGAMPFINLSAGTLDQTFRRARVVGIPQVAMQLIAGSQVIPGRITVVGSDSAVLDLGVELRARLGAGGSLLGAAVGVQNVRITKVAGLPAAWSDRGTASDDRYAAPPGAPYTAHAVTVVTPAGLALAGTLTLPRGASSVHRAPVVVTISGSGQQNRNSEIAGVTGYAIFSQIADTLGRRGVGVLRLDDRGAGGSAAGPGEPNSVDFADDVRAALRWLRAHPAVDGARLGLLGHSEGGIIAPMVAAGDSLVAAVALLAAPSLPGRDLSAHQRRVALEQERIPAGARDSLFRRAQAQADSLATSSTANRWIRHYWSYDPRPAVRQLRMPVLIVHGDTDQQVPAAQADELASLLRDGGNRDVTLRRFPGVNHLLLDDPSGYWSGYAALPSKLVSPRVTGTIADWFAARLAVPARR